MYVDLAEALEKYVPGWSLANKDRVVDALSVKMSLFHIGIPVEHFHYRKMSGPELGNALMFNQAQSNSLVVETYRTWVDAESNCRRFEREVATLKIISRVREQVLETTEVSKASQASADAAYKARHKVVQELEVVNLKLDETQSKLAEVEEKWKTERHDMQVTHEKLLANHVQLENEKDEAERSRDRISKAQKDVLVRMTELVGRYEGETTKLYDLISELLLTKQWLLTDGAQWMVRLVHKSSELEKVVADITNVVNAYGVNEGLKQEYHAAKTSDVLVIDVLGFDEYAKITLDAAIESIN
ncbi:hypothetical protein Hanom_Chr04g00312551 [Helianthus anomalus]